MAGSWRQFQAEFRTLVDREIAALTKHNPTMPTPMQPFVHAPPEMTPEQVLNAVTLAAAHLDRSVGGPSEMAEHQAVREAYVSLWKLVAIRAMADYTALELLAWSEEKAAIQGDR